MSTQDASGIPFSISHDFSSFRLLELPEELVKLLSSSNPPTLQLKSDASSSNAVLCTESKTFPLRQVHTSNSLFIIQPHQAASADADSLPQDGFCAIASCGATIEISSSTDSALPFLQKLLPSYSNRDIPANGSSTHTSTLATIGADIPLSDGEIQRAWTQLCAFEAGNQAYRPTAAVLLALWKAILSASVAEGMNIGSPFLAEDLWNIVKDEEYPRGMFDAIMNRIVADDDADQMEVDSDTSKWLTVDMHRCSTWVATLLLETETRADQTVPTTKFVELWHDNILEGWRNAAELVLLQDVCTESGAGTIALRPNHRLAPAPVATEPATDKSIKARKWHDKFKKAKG